MRLLRKFMLSLKLTYFLLSLITSLGHLLPTSQIPKQWLLMPFQFFGNLTFFYAFPPFSIIPKVLQKIQAEEATGLLVVPCWLTQPWWPLVMRLLVQEPLVLPKKKHLISTSTARLSASPTPEAHTQNFASPTYMYQNVHGSLLARRYNKRQFDATN